MTDVTFHTQAIFGSYDTAICAHLGDDDGDNLSCLFWLGKEYGVRFGTCMSRPFPNTTTVVNPERYGVVTDTKSFKAFVAAFVTE